MSKVEFMSVDSTMDAEKKIKITQRNTNRTVFNSLFCIQLITKGFDTIVN